MMILALPFKAYASDLIPEQCTIGNGPVFHPIHDIGFTFDGAVKTADNSIASVYMDEQPVATGRLSASNYVGEKRTQGTVVVSFDSLLVLPKGHTYRVIIPEGVIFKENDPSVSNKELSVEFEVPATLGDAEPSVEEGTVVNNARRIGFYYSTEIAAVGNSELTLFREDIPIKKYASDVSWDWNLGYAGIDFGEPTNFEAGVKYTIKIPEGCVSALHRSDITNEEFSVSFIGGYNEPVRQIQFVWCSLYDDHPSDVINEVRFYYDRPVSLCVNPRVQLYNETDKIVVKEVVPTLSEENGKWILTADFQNTPLIPEKGYTVIIPEGTLVSTDGNVIVNSRNSTSVENGNTSDICNIRSSETAINVKNRIITINNADENSKIRLFSLDGKTVYTAKPANGTASFSVPKSGIYLLSTNGKTQKITIK